MQEKEWLDGIRKRGMDARKIMVGWNEKGRDGWMQEKEWMDGWMQ